MSKFSHAYDFAFELTSYCEEATDVTPDMIRTALIKRATEIDDNEIMEACGCFDTHEIEGD